jgi:ketosteroid isomerase-like protein
MPIMKTIGILCMFALLLGGVSRHAQADAGSEVLKLEQDFNAAYSLNDLDKYFAFYSQDAILWFPEGRTDVPSYRKDWNSFINTGARIQSSTLSDLHVQSSPQSDSAIASYVLHLQTVGADKKVADEIYQETDVWFKTAGGWKITHVHYSHAPHTATK